MNGRFTYLTAALLATASLLLASPRVPARPPVPVEWDNHAFRFILWQANLKAVASLEDLAREDPAHCLLVVFGDTTPLERISGGLRSFVEQGGAVLIATDRGPFTRRHYRTWSRSNSAPPTPPLPREGRSPRMERPEGRGVGRPFEPGVGPDGVFSGRRDGGGRFRPEPADTSWKTWEKEIGVRITGWQVQATVDNSKYHEAPDCPILRPIPARGLPQPPVSLPIATSRPSYLEPNARVLTPFLGFPADCRADDLRDLPGQGLFLPFGAGGTLGKGRILVLADHSIFINRMMLQQDDGNFDFAYACVNWLRGPERREQALFIDEGAEVTSFEVPLTLNPGVGPSPVELANQIIGQMEEEDFFNKFLLKHFTLSQVLRAVAVVATFLLLVYGLIRLVRAVYHVEAQVPLVSQRVEQLVPALGVVDQRHQALLRQDNLWEAARDLARAYFAGLGIHPPTLPPWDRWRQGPRAVLPRISTTAGWWQRRTLRETVFRLWHLAASPQPRRISRRRFAQLVNQVEVVKAALRDGTLRIDGPRETA